MVKDPGAPSRARAIRPLNAPAPVTVRTDVRGTPVSFLSTGTAQEVSAVDDMWKINDEWWRGPGLEIERVYFRARLPDGRPVTLFHDLVRNAWFRQ